MTPYWRISCRNRSGCRPRDSAIREPPTTAPPRLTSSPDWWCSGLATENPTEEDIRFWQDVFETHRKALGKTTKPKTRNQIVKWLLNPYRDSAEYKMWGNGVALPCVWFVLSGIAYFFQDTGTKSPE